MHHIPYVLPFTHVCQSCAHILGSWKNQTGSRCLFGFVEYSLENLHSVWFCLIQKPSVQPFVFLIFFIRMLAVNSVADFFYHYRLTVFMGVKKLCTHGYTHYWVVNDTWPACAMHQLTFSTEISWCPYITE